MVTYIYESPNMGEKVYRRVFGDYDSPRELIRDESGWLIPKDEIPTGTVRWQTTTK